MDNAQIKYEATLKYLGESREPQPVVVSWNTHELHVRERASGTDVFCLPTDEANEVSLTSNSAVAMHVRKRTSQAAQMVALYFDHREQAQQFHSWCKGQREQTQLRLKSTSIAADKVTTAIELPNYRIVKCLGIVSGITVVGADPVAAVATGLKSMVGGTFGALIEMCEWARSEAHGKMLAQALKLNANAVVAVRYDSNEVVKYTTEFLAYGTAVIVEPVDASEASS